MNGGYAIFAINGSDRSYTTAVDSLARQKELESPTFRLGGGRSIQLSYWRIYWNIVAEKGADVNNFLVIAKPVRGLVVSIQKICNEKYIATIFL